MIPGSFYKRGCQEKTLLLALLAGKIDGEQQSHGVLIPFADLLIGATVLSLGFSVITGNLCHFQKIPGLAVPRL